MKKVWGIVFAGIVLANFSAMTGHAQATWGAISGYVTDQTGAAVAGAKIIVTNEKTGVQTVAVGDYAGLYNVTHLNPGQYNVAVEATGFKRFAQEHVILQVDSTVTVDPKLDLGAVSQQVTVSAAAAPLQTEKTDVAKTLSEQTIQALPTLGHNLSKLYDIVPGAVENILQIGEGETPSGATSVTVNGMWFGANEYLIDGITDMACCFSNQMVFVPNQESVAEMKVTTTDYDPEFGNTAGLVAQFVTKSGTNELHGAVFWSNLNKATFAADPFTEKIPGTGPNGVGTGPAPFNQNQGGFGLGGPIRKNKMFIFGGYQLLRRRQGATLTTTVPNDAWRNGDFSDLAATHPIYDPATGNPDGTGRSQISCLGVLNVICPDRFSTVAKNLLGLLPHANINQSTDVNYVGSGKVQFKTDQIDTRWDWNITDRDKLFVRNTYLHSYLLNPPLFGIVAGGPPVGGLASESVPTYNDGVALNYTRTFGANLLAEFRGGLLRWHLLGYQSDANLKTNDEVGIPGLNLGGRITGGLAGFVIGGPVGGFIEGPGPNNVALPRLDIINVWEGVNNWTWMRGHHQMRWGADIRRNMEDLFTINAHTEGYFGFGQQTTGTPDVPESGLSTASFLLGLPNSFQRGVFNFIPHERQWRNALYGQDSWRITPKLSVNYGLRWDYFGPETTDLKAGLANFDPGSGDLLLANLGGVSNSTNVNGYHKAFSPRLGLAYKLTENTVIRAGLGRSYFATNYASTFQTLAIVYPIAPTQSVPLTNIYQPVFPIDQGVPPVPPFDAPSSGHLKAPPGVSFAYVPPYTRTEHVDAWNATVEHLFGHDLRVTLAYVGNKGTNLAWGPNINAAPVGPGSLLSRRPYFQKYGLSQGIGSRCNCADSNYNAMQFIVDKRFSRGYSIVSAFTWSKALDHEIAGFAWADQSTNPYDRKGSYGVGTNQDRAVVWTLTHQWQLPYGPGLRWGSNITGIKKALLSGWQANGITIVEDGFALSPVLGSGSTLNADFGQRPDRIPGVSLYPANKNTDQWFNPAAFQAPQFPGQAVQCCRWGNAARGSIRGPGLFVADWAFWKEFGFKSPLNREDTRLQIRWENYNFFNHALLGEPNMTVDSSTAGRITGLLGTFIKSNAVTMRRMEFTLRLQF
jgi:outer membrane receptor protein involved in Fe transport